MKKFYLGKWDNLPEDDPKRQEGVDQVLKELDIHCKCKVCFDYEGRTRHDIAAINFCKKLHGNQVEFDCDIDRYELTITKIPLKRRKKNDSRTNH